ncbi:hypothetical protein EVAR_91524_1 [Eumeta japonica]|uniref:Uncharacterized protein n=1 Tax=Eumeta variegata TaxID=151549 RepID=A0A4C1VBG9_EUMVA|nr:hypothetical protein EVAR_91524_1 [Eumeta japonica]
MDILRPRCRHLSKRSGFGGDCPKEWRRFGLMGGALTYWTYSRVKNERGTAYLSRKNGDNIFIEYRSGYGEPACLV